MKIEKVNDNQIRCTLTKEDLASRQLKISELAYGTEKAKSLFRDMMQQANYEFGFEAEDMPLMIEAIPMNAECIVLVITKVEDPDELDTRFARFAPSVTDAQDDADNYDPEEADVSETTDEVMDLFQRIQNQSSAPEEPVSVSAESSGVENQVRLFCFTDLHTLISAGKKMQSISMESSLYKDDNSGRFLLFLENFNDVNYMQKVTNHFSEYAILLRINPSTPAYLKEHCKCMIAEGALQQLAAI